jgi:hypothetical protein
MKSCVQIYEQNAAECEREGARAATAALKNKYRGLAPQWRELVEQKKRSVVRRPKAAIVAEQERSKARLEWQERINRENRERELAALTSGPADVLVAVPNVEPGDAQHYGIPTAPNLDERT